MRIFIFFVIFCFCYLLLLTAKQQTLTNVTVNGQSTMISHIDTVTFDFRLRKYETTIDDAPWWGKVCAKFCNAALNADNNQQRKICIQSF